MSKGLFEEDLLCSPRTKDELAETEMKPGNLVGGCCQEPGM